MAIIIEETPIEQSQIWSQKNAYEDMQSVFRRLGILVGYRTIQSLNYAAATAGWIIRANGTAEFTTLISGSFVKTFAQDAIPTSENIGDLWIDTNDSNKLYRAAAVGATTIAAGQWELKGTAANWSTVIDDDGNKPDNNADVTSAHTSDDTSKVNAIASTLVQPRAELLWKKGLFIGSKTDGMTETGAGVSRGHLLTKLLCNSSVNSLLSSAVDFSAKTFSFDRTFEIIAVLQLTTTAGQNSFWGLQIGMNPVVPPSNATYVDDHCGFFVDDATLYASVGQGSGGGNQTRTSIAGITLTNDNVYRVVFTPGVSALFYVNDVLKATITTNLPNDTTGAKFLILQEAVDAVERDMFVYNNYMINYNL